MEYLICLVKIIFIIVVLVIIILVLEIIIGNQNDEYIEKYSSITEIDPKINLMYINNLLTNEECDYLIKLSNGHFTNSHVISKDGGSELSSDRTSQSYIVNELDPKVKKIKNKINLFLSENVDEFKNWNDHIENTQIVKYEIGQQYKAHYDFFREEYIEKYVNQRNYTIFIYLNDVKNGGETYFPNLDKKLKPVKGSALFWKNCTDTNVCFDESLHQGLPPLEGTKYGMNVWIRFDKLIN